MGDVLKVAALVIVGMVLLEVFRDTTKLGGSVFVNSTTWKANNGT